MADFHQHWWLHQPARKGRIRTSNTATISSVLRAVTEPYTTESPSRRKRHLLDIIIGAPADGSAILAPDKWVVSDLDLPEGSVICIIDAKEIHRNLSSLEQHWMHPVKEDVTVLGG
ncbi:unnamed protein product [Albugo candida]|uniref:Uncharacterized protein n=1 Tax=Albugo candida TaxID=65357 RepID=A0A024GU59_9STRA|nr:unnamed protein product [Albugo candida]|eukprot:CCI50131.1 unnamed protein product [Albugo candida]